MAETPTGRQSSGRGLVTGYLLKVIREGCGLTQSRFAEYLHVDTTTVQGWESGRRPLPGRRVSEAIELRCVLLGLGAEPSMVASLDTAMEADYILGRLLAEPPGALALHPLGAWVYPRALCEVLAWALRGDVPEAVQGARSALVRRGPVPEGPEVSADERRQVFAHLRVVADRATLRSEGALLSRQAHYLSGYDRDQDTGRWLERSFQRYSRSKGWSASWPEARSVATSLTRCGDPEPLHDFIRTGLSDDAGELANLNYWAYWVGEFETVQPDDRFMLDERASWRGDRLLRHLVEHMAPEYGYLQLYVHTTWALLVHRPDLVNAPSTTTRRLAEKARSLLDYAHVAGQARAELEAILYAVRLNGR